MNPTLFVAFLFVCNHFCIAQNVTGPIGAKVWMIGGCSAAQTDVWSANNNPAASATIKNIQGGLYTEQRFNEPNLRLSNVSLVVPTKHIHIGAAINHFGHSAFNQQRLTVSLSKSLSSMFALGVQLNYVSTFIQDYGSAGNIALALGLYVTPTSKIHLGFVVFNPTQNSYGKYTTEKIPSYGRLGCAYDVSDKITLNIEADQTLNQPLVWRAGLHYRIHEVIHLAMGVATQPTYLTFGTSLHLKKMKIDVATSFHEVLGFTPHIGIAVPVSK